MTREEAIKWLETHIAYHQSGAWPFAKTDEAMQMAIAALREQPRWISVEERLPEPFVSVLVYMPDERPLPTVHEGYFVRDTNKWYSHFFDRSLDEVTHWMPLPEPPEVEV